MNTTAQKPAYLTAAENRYNAMCLDEEATPAQVREATDALHAAQANARADEASAILDDFEAADQPTDGQGNPVCRNCGTAHYMHQWVNNGCHSIA